jgi:hypothetical protein
MLKTGLIFYMKYITSVVVFFLLISCSSLVQSVDIDRQITDNFVVGRSGYFYGFWGKHSESDSLINSLPYYELIFKRPDAIIVKEQYIFLKRKNKYCLILNEDRDSLVSFDDIIKSRNKEKVESLIEGLE